MRFGEVLEEKKEPIFFFSLQAGVTAFSGLESPVRETWNRRRGTSDTLGLLWTSVHRGLGWLADSGSLFSRNKRDDELSEG